MNSPYYWYGMLLVAAGMVNSKTMAELDKFSWENCNQCEQGMEEYEYETSVKYGGPLLF